MRAQSAVQGTKPAAVAAKPANGVLSSVEVLQLSGTLKSDGKTQSLTFDLPSDAVGLVIQAHGDPKTNYVISGLTDATGKQLVQSAPTPSGGVTDAFVVDRAELESLNRAQLGERLGNASVMVPNNPKVTLKPGKGWKVQVQGWDYKTGKYVRAKGAVKIDVIVKRAPKKPTAGRLNLHLYFNGSGGYTKSTAQKSELISNMLDGVRAAYKKAGIEIGTVTFDDLPSMPKQPRSFDEMDKSFAANKYSDGVGVFFTDQVMGSPLIAGAAGGLPGPAVAPSLARSGVLMATNLAPLGFSPQGGGDAFAGTLAHELGHYLGLFHTRDEFLNIDDPLPDTKNDYDNLMFPTDLRASSKFTAQQAAVLLRHPAVQVTK